MVRFDVEKSDDGCSDRRRFIFDWLAGMGEIEKVGNLESQNLGIKNHLRNTGIKKSHIGLVKILCSG
jgi:hypothetical protein